ncbi:MAG: RIO1 family regulatory kinase/ATPase [Patescibacteria group bacterium]|jgi:RIO kinase 1
MNSLAIQTVTEHAKRLGHTVEIVSSIKSGKEASVFRALLDGKLTAIKVYKDPSEGGFKNTDVYLDGKFYKNASEERAVASKNKFGKKLKQENWIKREFYMLQRFYMAGAMIPKPLLLIDNAIFMELLGSDETVASRLIDVKLTATEASSALRSIIESVRIFWNLGVVHADLSAYNILWWNQKPFIIDFPQSIDVRTHPDARIILERDINNIAKYFNKYIPVDTEEIKKKFN